MCVIIVKPAGQSLPPKSELKRAFGCNSDGCGFVSETAAYHSLDFEKFYSRLRFVPVNQNCIIHFRWATHGSVSLKNCHPFCDRASGTWFAHNGMLNVLPKGDRTDSETAFRWLLAPYIRRYGLASPVTEAAIEQVRANTGSRFAFMKDGRVTLFGEFIQYGGCLYSNLRHLKYARCGVL